MALSTDDVMADHPQDPATEDQVSNSPPPHETQLQTFSNSEVPILSEAPLPETTDVLVFPVSSPPLSSKEFLVTDTFMEEDIQRTTPIQASIVYLDVFQPSTELALITTDADPSAD